MWFVSHASADNGRIDQLAARLQAGGIAAADLWIDHQHGIETGDEWQRNIQAAVNNSAGCIFVLTPASAASRWCESEWTRFLAEHKRLYVVLLDPVPLRDFPLRLGVIQYADLTADYDGGVSALLRALTGSAPLDRADPAVKTGRRISGDIDPRLTVPMQGRAADLSDALRLIGEAPLFITGIGGLGKSRLAYALVSDDDRWSGAVWHRCSDLSTPEDVYALLREHYALDPTTDPRAVLSSVRSAGRLLVVIDNAESVTGDAPQRDYTRLIHDLRGAGAAVCVTSRVDWRDVTPKRRLEPSHLDAEAAATLVAALAYFLGIEQTVAAFSRDLADAARRHPRLIELAVGKLDYMPPDAVIAELRALQSREAQDALTGMIRVTVDQMTAKHGDAPYNALRRLTVCRGGFTADAGAALIAPGSDADAFFPLVRTLVDYRFVRFDPETERYAIDDLVIEAVGADASAHRPHYDYYLAFARRLEASPDHLKYLKLDAERDNLDAAFAWALDADPAAAYWLANACNAYLANRARYAQRMDWLTALERVLAGHPDARTKAALQASLGIVYQDHPFGSRRDNLQRAVEAYEAALTYWQQAGEMTDYAATQNNLGTAYADLANLNDPADRADNLQRATAAYTEALRFLTPDAAPLDYAGTQNNLGNAYADLAKVEDPAEHVDPADRADNLQRAVAAYTEALRFRTPDAAPLQYAMTQYNLGAAYADLAKLGDPADRADKLQRATAAYTEALRFRTPDAAPLDYAMTQNNLGVAYADLARVEEHVDPEEYDDRAENLQRATAAYTEALRFRTPDAAPLQYAMTQSNLGAAYADLAKLGDPADRVGSLKRATAAYTEALRFHTPDAAPLQYAGTQRNLGIALEDSGDLPGAIRCWREAYRYFRAMGDTANADRMLTWIADAEAELGDSPSR